MRRFVCIQQSHPVCCVKPPLRGSLSTAGIFLHTRMFLRHCTQLEDVSFQFRNYSHEPNNSDSVVESCFEQPNEFIPERWFSRPSLIKNKSAFAPFSIGTLSFFLSSLSQFLLTFPRPLFLRWQTACSNGNESCDRGASVQVRIQLCVGGAE